MRRLLQIAFAGWLALSMSLAQAWAFPDDGGSSVPTSGSPAGTVGYTKDSARSDALTSYLKAHRLPLIGAQVLNDPSSGQRVVVLYGFVATDFGKNDATTKARAFLHDPSATVENRVMVDPEIASRPPRPSHHAYADGGGSSTAPDSSANSRDYANADDGSSDGPGSADNPPDSYLEHQSQQSQIQQYENQQNPMANGGIPGGLSGMIGGGGMLPLIALLGLLNATNGGSSFSFGSGPSSMSGPYRNPYGGGSPYGYPPGAFPSAPYGSPYGGSPGSFSAYP